MIETYSFGRPALNLLAQEIALGFQDKVDLLGKAYVGWWTGNDRLSATQTPHDVKEAGLGVDATDHTGVDILGIESSFWLLG